MQPDQQGHWQPETVSPDDAVPHDVPAQAAVNPDDEHPLMSAVSWEASEYIHHEKNISWYIGLGVIGLVLVLVSLFLLKSITFTVLIVVMVGAVVFMAVRPPRVMHYQLSAEGIQINDSTYGYKDFRAFGVVQDGPMYYITLLPIKRFMPAIDIYFPQENGEQIVDLLGAHMPIKTVEPDFVDRLTRQLRF